MEIKIAKHYGFCYGVNRAYVRAIEEKEKGRNVYIYGEIVHNPVVIDELNRIDVKKFDSLEEIPADAKKSTVIIRAHGVPLKEKEILESSFENVIDMTCPIVESMFKYALHKQNEGSFVVAFGKEKHPEMIGLKGNLNPQRIVITDKAVQIKPKKVTIISQTTMNSNEFQKFHKEMSDLNNFLEFSVKNTICVETILREEEATELSEWADCVIIIGGKNSSNTKKLYEIAKKNCQNTLHIEYSDELKEEDYSMSEKIAILSGSSTPKELVEKTLEKIKKS